MQIHPGSLLLGFGAAALVPLFSRVLRPLAVEAIAAGLGIFEEGRRLVAQQMETLEDIAAEARARRAEIIASGDNGHFDLETAPEEESATASADGRARRRPSAGSRRRVS